MIGDGPQHVGVCGGSLGEGGPLGVAHDAASGALAISIERDAGKLAAGDERRRWGSWVSALRGHEIGEIQASGGDSDNGLSWFRGGSGAFRTASASGPESAVIIRAFIEESLAGWQDGFRRPSRILAVCYGCPQTQGRIANTVPSL